MESNRHIYPKIYEELPAISAGKSAKTLSVYTDRLGNKAIVLPGLTVSLNDNENIIWGENQGLVLYEMTDLDIRNTSPNEWHSIEILKKYNQIVWVPVRFLKNKVDISKLNIQKELLELQKQVMQSIKKYGGFFISRYFLSPATKHPYFVLQYPKLVYNHQNYYYYLDFYCAEIVVRNSPKFGYGFKPSIVKNYIPFGWEYDLIKEWIIETKMQDSGTLKDNQIRSINNIFRFTTHVGEWTQEQGNKEGEYITRGSIWETWEQTSLPVDCRRSVHMNKEKVVRPIYYIADN